MENKTAKQYREERANVVAQMIELNAQRGERAFTAEEKEKFDRLDVAATELLEQAETVERAEKLSLLSSATKETFERSIHAHATANNYKPTELDYRNAFKAWSIRGFENEAKINASAVNDWRKSAERCGVNLYADKHFFTRAAMASGTGSEGGYLVSTFPVQAFENALLAYSKLRQEATVYVTDAGGNYPFALNNDTGNKGAIIGENTTVTEADPTISQMILGDYTYHSKSILASFQVIQDSAFPLDSWVTERCGIRIARIQNDHYTTGDGSSKPYGVLTQATDSGVTTAHYQSIDWKELVSLVQALDPAYQDQDPVLMMHNQTFTLLLQMANTQNTPLFTITLDSAGFHRFMSYRIVINQSMPTPAASAKAILFGCMKKYIIRDVGTPWVKRLNERYADQGSIAWIGYHRSSGNLLDAGTHPVQFLTLNATTA